MAGGLEGDWVRVGTSEEVREAGITVVTAARARIAVFADRASEELSAVDNRCPHMGFPLQRGTVRDGILTCHWHQARFDLRSGCTFDLWADDVPRYEVRTDEDARRLHFLGSPSIRVNGVDIEPGSDARRDYALACRMYGSSGLPPREFLATALGSEFDEG